MIDFHMHSRYSHDACEEIDTLCQMAMEKKLTDIAVTDHADIGPCFVHDTYERIAGCIADVKKANEKYRGTLHIWQGIELAEYAYDRETADRILSLGGFDVVLGSVHFVPFREKKESYSCIDFSSFSDADLLAFMRLYFQKLKDMFEEADFDILTHLTCPLRYICGKYGRHLDLSVFYGDIKEILSRTVETEKTLELNTSGIDRGMDFLMPNREILAMYRALGGKRISVGSDAHVASRMALGFDLVLPMLKEIGFDCFTIYQNRVAKEIALA